MFAVYSSVCLLFTKGKTVGRSVNLTLLRNTPVFLGYSILESTYLPDGNKVNSGQACQTT